MCDSKRKEVRFLKSRLKIFCVGLVTVVTLVPLLGVVLKAKWGFHDGDL
jgi:hypothetical protein